MIILYYAYIYIYYMQRIRTKVSIVFSVITTRQEIAISLVEWGISQAAVKLS
jgi:hypothetical protein